MSTSTSSSRKSTRTRTAPRAKPAPSVEELSPEEEAKVERLRAKHDREEAIQAQLESDDIRAEAKRRRAAREARKIPFPEIVPTREFLNEEPSGSKFLIDGLWPYGGNVMFTALRKGGKTTTVGNLCRSLVDCEPFMGHFEVVEARRVALFDFEMPRDLLREWLADQQIQNIDDLLIVPMRGLAGAFDIRDKYIRRRWVKVLQEHDTELMILDPLLPILAALNIEVSSEEVGYFLDAVDTLKHEAGLKEVLITQHTGHLSPVLGATRDLRTVRPMGHSRQVGWADSLWQATLEDINDPTSTHYFGAYGRDVAVPPGVVLMKDRHQQFKTDVEEEGLDKTFDRLESWLKAEREADEEALERGDDDIDPERLGWRNTAQIQAAGLPGFKGNGVNAKLAQAVKAGRVGHKAEGRGKPTWYWALS